MSKKVRIPQKPKRRNYVAKHMHDMSGDGFHRPKKLVKSRSSNKHRWKKELLSDL